MDRANLINEEINIDGNLIKKDFPIFERSIRGKPLIYFDNAATTQRPRQVIESIKEFYSNHNANIHRAVHLLSYEATQMYEEAHKKTALFIGAESWSEIVFTRNATEALNLIAYAWGLWNLKEGDEILLTLMEHHSNIVPWQMLKKLKNIKIKYVNVRKEGRIDLEDYKRKLTDNVKIVSLIHASNVLGSINPIKEMIKLAKEIGAIAVVDAAQSIPHILVNVKEIGCDFLVASGHKMLGPTGIGFLYGKRELLENMNPFLYGGDMIEKVSVDEATWNELPWKYEAGTPNIANGIGLSSAIDYLNNIGMNNIHNYEHHLTKYALEKLISIPDIEIYGPLDANDRVGVISFNLKNIHPHDVASILDSSGIAVRSGHHCAQPLMNHLNIENAIRVSFYIYNTIDEIDKLIEVLMKIHKIFYKRASTK